MNLPFLPAVEPPLAEVAAGAPGLNTGAVVLVLLVAVVAWLVSSLANLRAEVEELKESLRAKVRPGPAAVTRTGPSPAEIAAITAAVHCVLGSRARLTAVGSADSSGQQAWSREGRRQVFQSHQLR
jgi:hypothetical protein